MKSKDKTEPNLTKKQLVAIPVILEARSIREGVKKAGISKTTFYEWLKEPLFKAEFIRQSKEIVDLALHELKVSTSEAVSVLRELLGAEAEGVRLRTALGILDYIAKFTHLEELEERISQLERKVGR